MRNSSATSPIHSIRTERPCLRPVAKLWQSCGLNQAATKRFGPKYRECLNRERTTSRISLDSYLNGILSKGRVLRNRSVHCDRSWIVRSRVRTRAAAGPTGKTITHLIIVGWCCTNRNGRSGVSPPTAGQHRAARSVSHRQIILRPECRGVGPVCGRRNSVRYGAVVAPLGPYVRTPVPPFCGEVVAMV